MLLVPLLFLSGCTVMTQKQCGVLVQNQQDIDIKWYSKTYCEYLIPILIENAKLNKLDTAAIPRACVPYLPKAPITKNTTGLGSLWGTSVPKWVPEVMKQSGLSWTMLDLGYIKPTKGEFPWLISI